MITPEQAAQRIHHIGGSDAPVIAGEVGSRLELWLEKTERVKPRPSNDAMEAGSFVERGVVDWAAYKLGKEIQRDMPTLVHADGIRAANLDGFVPELAAIVEAKSSGIVSGRVYELELWGDPMTDGVPPRVAVQCQHNMDVAANFYGARIERAYVPALLVGVGLVLYVVPFSERLSGILADLEGTFWQDHVVKDVPPDDTPETIDVLKRVLRGEAKTVPIDTKLVTTWNHARVQRLGWEKEEQRALAGVLQALGDAEIGTVDGGEFTYLEQQRAGYEVQPTSFRVPRWKPAKENR